MHLTAPHVVWHHMTAYICSAKLPSSSLYFLSSDPRDILPQTAVSFDLINNVYIAFPNLILPLCSQIKCVGLGLQGPR